MRILELMRMSPWGHARSASFPPDRQDRRRFLPSVVTIDAMMAPTVPHRRTATPSASGRHSDHVDTIDGLESLG